MNDTLVESVVSSAEEKPMTNLVGPGARLRAARLAAQLSQEDVAQQIKITAKVVADMENDIYHQIPNFVFLRGYLRAYANIVGVSGDEVIASFNRLNLSELPSGRPRWTLNNEIMAPRRSYRWVSYVVLCTLVVFVGLWWHSQKNNSVSLATGQLKLNLSKQQSEPTYNQIKSIDKTTQS